MNNSFGIIVFTDTRPRRFLIVQRRDSLSFLRLIRKFHLFSKEEIVEQINGMTKEEAKRLLTKSFDSIWADLYLNHNSRIYNTEERRVRINFENLRVEYRQQLEQTAASSRHILEWGFPKGKRNPNESSLTCAYREFQEETRLDPDMLWMVNTPPFYYHLDYGNGHITKVECWLGKVHKPEYVQYLSTTIRPYISDEVGSLEWATYEELLQRLPESIQEVAKEVDLFVNLHC